MKLQPITIVFVSLCFCLWLTACTASQGEVTPAETVVTFMVHGDPHEQEAFASVVAGFHASAPHVEGRPVRVDLIGLPSAEDFLTRLTTDFAAGTPPDVFLLNYRRLAQFYNRGAVEPLGPWIADSEKIAEDDFFAVAMDAFRDSQGTVVCIPQNISSQVVYYNRDLFDAAGHPYPEAGWTWEDFRRTAIALTLPDADNNGEPDQYGLGLEPHLVRVAPFIWQNGGDLVDDPAAPTRFTLDTPMAVEAIQFVLDLAQVDGVVPNRTAEAVKSHAQRFYAGNIAMYVDSRRIVPTMRAVAEFNWDVAPLPRGKVTASILHSDGYCMAAASQQKAAAWAFIEFALSPAGQEPAARLGRTVPSLIAVANSEVYLDPTQAPAGAHVWLDAVPYLRVLPRLENWVRIERTAAIEFEQAYLGLTTLSDVVDYIQSESANGFSPLK